MDLATHHYLLWLYSRKTAWTCRGGSALLQLALVAVAGGGRHYDMQRAPEEMDAEEMVSVYWRWPWRRLEKCGDERQSMRFRDTVDLEIVLESTQQLCRPLSYCSIEEQKERQRQVARWRNLDKGYGRWGEGHGRWEEGHGMEQLIERLLE